MDGKSSVKCSWNYHNQLFIPSEIEKDLITSDNALLLTCHNAAKYTLNPLTQIPHAYRKHFWNQPNCHIVINSDKLVSREVTFHSTKKRKKFWLHPLHSYEHFCFQPWESQLTLTPVWSWRKVAVKHSPPSETRSVKADTGRTWRWWVIGVLYIFYFPWILI